MRALRLLGDIRRLATPYFRSEERFVALGLLGAIIALELAWVYASVLLNAWNSDFFNAIQDKDFDAFQHQLLVFCAIAAGAIVVAVYQVYLKQWLIIRWRRWLTRRYTQDWLSDDTYYRLRLQGDTADNPDQRIADDVREFVVQTLSIGVGLFGALVSLVSFSFILWHLSGTMDLPIFGTTLAIPGYLFWAALLYAALGTVIAHVIGRKLVRLNFDQERYEADFRLSLVRVRESSEQIALLGGEPEEARRLDGRFGRIWENFLAQIRLLKRLTWFTAGYNQVSNVFPYIVVSPAYFSGAILLGPMMQTVTAFTSVQTSFSFFITSYSELAEWTAVVNRLTGFERAMAAAKAATQGARVNRQADPQAPLSLHALDVRLPGGAPLVQVDALQLSPGEHAVLMGPSGSGKSSLLRAIAGIWPFASGEVREPAGAGLMTLPQRPYVPVGRLDGALAYPGAPDTYPRLAQADVLEAVGLAHLVPRLEETALWPDVLSPGEQQRLAIARALLARPRVLLLDEATAALDEEMERRIYALLRARLPETAILSIGHRASLRDIHDRVLCMAGREAPRRVEAEPAGASV